MSRFQLSFVALATSFPVVAFATTLIVSFALPFGGRARAQDVLLDVKSPVARALARNGIAIGDWDGDGIGDLAIGAIWDSTVAFDAGAVRIHSGKDGSILATFYGTNAIDYFGESLARTPDLDGDGIDDLAVTAIWADNSGTDTGSVFLYAGRTGALLRRIDGPATGGSFGDPLGVVDDVDLDGIADLYVGGGGLDVIHIHSGFDGHEITTLNGPPGEGFGSAASSIADLDGDGLRDLLVGARHALDSSGNMVGGAYVVSTATGAILRKHLGVTLAEYLGYGTAALADLDGDGIADYGVSAMHDDDGTGSMVLVYSGRSGSQLAVLESPKIRWWLDYQFAAAGDVNGDGVGDLVISGGWDDATNSGHGAAILVSGKTFEQLDRIERQDAVTFVAPLGDLNGDGFDDVIVGAFDSSFDGEVVVYSGNDLWLKGTPSQPRARQQLDLTTREGVPGALTILVLEAVDGVPTFQVINGISTFGAYGGSSFNTTVPSGLAGHTATFRAYANDASGHVIQSATDAISFQ